MSSSKSDCIRIATRKSPLAMVQTQMVLELLQKKWPSKNFEVISMTTSGDRFADQKLADIGGKGLFIKELELALLNDEADLAVHSLKDVPGSLPDSLIINCFPLREDPKDLILFSRNFRGGSYSELPKEACVGSSSFRRQAQIRMHRKDLRFEDIRGNVQTRLSKLYDPKSAFDAIILAAAGLNRLDIEPENIQVLQTSEMVPAVGQGILGIECRKADEATLELLDGINDKQVKIVAECERAFLKYLNADCHVPIAGHATIQSGKVYFTGFIGSIDGQNVFCEEGNCEIGDHEELGGHIARVLLNRGGQTILDEFSK